MEQILFRWIIHPVSKSFSTVKQSPLFFFKNNVVWDEIPYTSLVIHGWHSSTRTVFHELVCLSGWNKLVLCELLFLGWCHTGVVFSLWDMKIHQHISNTWHWQGSFPASKQWGSVASVCVFSLLPLPLNPPCVGLWSNWCCWWFSTGLAGWGTKNLVSGDLD